MKTKVILGDITFIEPNDSKENTYKAIINRIDAEVEVEDSDLDDFCEKSLETYESYLIPSEYNGEIIYPTNL